MRKLIVMIAACGAISLSDKGAVTAEGPGLYSDAQAQQGQPIYNQSCAGCHGADLQSGSSPALKGERFHGMARAQSLTVASLLRVVQQTMPKDNPGSLSSEQYEAVVAYILKQNGYTSGPMPLRANETGLTVSLAQAPTSPLAGNDHGVTAMAPTMAETVQTAPITADVMVSDAMLKGAAADKDNWLLFGRTYENQRFSPLTQINTKTVKRLVPV